MEGEGRGNISSNIRLIVSGCKVSNVLFKNACEIRSLCK